MQRVRSHARRGRNRLRLKPRAAGRQTLLVSARSANGQTATNRATITVRR